MLVQCIAHDLCAACTQFPNTSHALACQRAFSAAAFPLGCRRTESGQRCECSPEQDARVGYNEFRWWCCSDQLTCTFRALATPNLMSSSSQYFPDILQGNGLGGVLDGDVRANPYMNTWNHVSVGYCSSDVFLGNTGPSEPPRERGSRVMESNRFRCNKGRIVDGTLCLRQHLYDISGQKAAGLTTKANAPVPCR